VKPNSYKSANISIYMGGAKSSEEKGHKAFYRDCGGKVFILNQVKGIVSKKQEKLIRTEYNLLPKMKPRKIINDFIHTKKRARYKPRSFFCIESHPITNNMYM